MFNMLSVGYHIDMDSVSKKLHRQDGVISSLLLFSFLFSWTAAFYIAGWNHWFHYLGHVVRTYTILLGIVSTTCALVLTFSNRKAVTDMYEKVTHSRPGLLRSDDRDGLMRFWVSRVLQASLPLVGVVSFFVFGAVYDILWLGGNAQCLASFCLCDWRTLSYLWLGFTMDVVRFVFKASGLLFCLFFHEKAFVPSTAARYSLLLVCSGIISYWLAMLICLTNGAFPPTYYPHLNFSLDNNTGHHHSLTDLECLNFNTSLFRLSGKVAVYFAPFQIEFSLLFCSTVMELFFSIKPTRPPPINSTNFDQTAASESSKFITVIQQLDGFLSTKLNDPLRQSPDSLQQDSYCQTQDSSTPAHKFTQTSDHIQCEDGAYDLGDTPGNMAVLAETTTCTTKGSLEELDPTPELIPLAVETASILRALQWDLDVTFEGGDPDDSMSLPLPMDGDHADGHTTTDTQIVSRTYVQSLTSVTTFLVLLHNLLYVASAFISYANPPAVWLTIYTAIKGSCNIAVLVLCMMGFHQASHFKTRPTSFHALELILLVTTCGNTLFLFFTVLPMTENFTTLQHSSEALASLWSAITNTIGTYLQVALLCHISRLVTDRYQVCNNLRATVLYLVAYNFSVWVVDSFVEYTAFGRLYPMHTKYFGQPFWAAFCGIIFPFLIFFRFYSSILFLQIYLGLWLRKLLVVLAQSVDVIKWTRGPGALIICLNWRPRAQEIYFEKFWIEYIILGTRCQLLIAVF